MPRQMRDARRALPRDQAGLTLPDCAGARLAVPTLSPIPGRHTHEVNDVIMMSRNPWILRRSFGRRGSSSPSRSGMAGSSCRR